MHTESWWVGCAFTDGVEGVPFQNQDCVSADKSCLNQGRKDSAEFALDAGGGDEVDDDFFWISNLCECVHLSLFCDVI